MSQEGVLSFDPSKKFVETLTGNTGGPVGVDAADNIDILGNNGTGIDVNGNPGTHTLTIVGLQPTTSQRGTPSFATAVETGQLSITTKAITPNSLGPILVSEFVVAPGGAYTTIQSALNAANAAGGGIVYVRPGTYTENLTLYGNTEVVGATGNSDINNAGNAVIIIGVHTPPTTGFFSFNNIFLQSATDVFNSVAAGTATLILENCITSLTNGYIYNCPNWTAAGIFAGFDNEDNNAGNNAVVFNTGGALSFFRSSAKGSGVNPAVISGPAIFRNIDFGCPISFTTGAVVEADVCDFEATVTMLNNSTARFERCDFHTGSTPALTMSSSSGVSLNLCIIDTTNNPSITGAGAGVLTLNDITFTNNAALAGTLTISRPSTFDAGAIRGTSATLTTPLGVASGGTGLATITAHDLVVGNGTSALNLIAPSATSGVPLISQGAAADPAFGTAVVAGGGTGITTTTAFGVICGGTTATGNFQNSGAGLSGQILQSGGAAALPAYTTATYPATATGTGTILRADGTNWVATTATYPTTTTSQQILYSTAANVIGQLTTANSKFPATNSSGTLAMRALSIVNQVFTTPGANTYTPTAGMVYCIIQCLGGGGGGGGAPATAGGQFSAGSGGGAGEYAQGTFSAASIGVSQSVTIAAAGTANSGAAGGNGGNTSVGALISANGGTGGAAIGPSGSPSNNVGTLGGTGGSGGDLRTPGHPGNAAFFSVGSGFLMAGIGGNSQYGSGGLASIGGAGSNGLGFGSGGGGAAIGGSTGAASGGAGTAGIVIVTEFVIA